MRKRRGQTTIEYVLLLTLLLLGILYGVNTVMKDKVKATMDTSGKVIDKGTSHLAEKLALPE